MTDAYILLANGKKFELKKESNSVGRVAENDIQIDDQSISRNHAILKFEADGWTVMDLGSKNKTFVSEKPIEPNKAILLKDGTTLHFGYVAVKFHSKKANQTGNETLAVDFNNPDIAAMLQEAGSHKSTPKASSAPDLSGVEEMRANRKSYAYLELRSVTNPTKYPIEKEAILIGTDAGECDVRLIDSTASPVHAEIRFLKGKKVQLKNLSQQTGTMLNGRRIGKSFIKEGDQIDIGDSSFTFHFVDWPDISAAKESGAATAARFIIALLVIVLLGGGSFTAYKMGYFGKKTAAGQATATSTGNAGATGGTAPTGSGNLSEALDLVTQKRYDESNDVFIRLLKTASDADVADLKAKQGEVLKLRQIKEKMEARDYVGAYVLAKSLDFQNSQVANRAADLNREVIRQFHQAVAKAKADMEDAESAGKWDDAINKVNLLKATADKGGEEIFEGSTEKLAQAEARIRTKQELQNVYALAMKDMNTTYQQTIDDTAAALDRAEAKSKDSPQMKADLAKYVTRVESAHAHAQLLKAYFEFDGQNMDEAKKFRNSIAVDYERRDDANARLARMEQISKIYGEYLTLLNDYKSDTAHTINPIHFYDQVLDKLEGMLAIEGDSRFELSKTASQDIVRLRDERKKKLLEAFSTTVTGPFPTGIRGDLERLLAERKRWFEYLQLFSLTVRDNRYKDLVLSEELKDDEVVSRFKEAYDRYDKSRSEILKVVLRNWQESTDMGLKKDSLTYIDRLQSLTLPEDKDTEKAILSAQNQLR